MQLSQHAWPRNLFLYAVPMADQALVSTPAGVSLASDQTCNAPQRPAAPAAAASVASSPMPLMTRVPGSIAQPDQERRAREKDFELLTFFVTSLQQSAAQGQQLISSQTVDNCVTAFGGSRPSMRIADWVALQHDVLLMTERDPVTQECQIYLHPDGLAAYEARRMALYPPPAEGTASAHQAVQELPHVSTQHPNSDLSTPAAIPEQAGQDEQHAVQHADHAPIDSKAVQACSTDVVAEATSGSVAGAASAAVDEVCLAFLSFSRSDFSLPRASYIVCVCRS